MENLATIAKENDTAKNVFAVFKARERFRRETNLLRLQRYLREDGKKVVEDEFMSLFKKLQDLGIGTLVVGRGNKMTRFKWHYNLRDVAKAASTNKRLSSKSAIKKEKPQPKETPIEFPKEATAVNITMTQDQLETLIKRLTAKQQ